MSEFSAERESASFYLQRGQNAPKSAGEDADFVGEVVVVDDGSSDGTYEVVGEFSRRDAGIKAVGLEKNCGKGCAMREGIRHSGGDVVVFMDADGQHKPGGQSNSWSR